MSRGESNELMREPSGRVGTGELPRGFRHLGTSMWVSKQREQFFFQPLRGRLVLRDDNRGPGIAEYSGVDDLFVAARAGQRNQHRWQTDIRELRDGSGAGATDNNIGRRIDIGKLIAHELEHAIPRLQKIRQGIAQSSKVFSIRVGSCRAGLVDDLSLIEERGQHIGDPLIDWAGATGAAGEVDDRECVIESKK